MIRSVLFFILLVIAVALYTTYDNNSVQVVKKEVIIDNLPESFNGFTILQITDLHGKRFGNRQEKLLSKINSSDYDMIAFTGDMLSSRNNDIKPFLEIINGVKNKKIIYFISGNNGLFAFDVLTGEINDTGKMLEEKGITLLNHAHAIKKGNDTLWVSTDVLNKPEIDRMLKRAKQAIQQNNGLKEVEYVKSQREYMLKLKEEFNQLKNDAVKIA